MEDLRSRHLQDISGANKSMETMLLNARATYADVVNKAIAEFEQIVAASSEALLQDTIARMTDAENVMRGTLVAAAPAIIDEIAAQIAGAAADFGAHAVSAADKGPGEEEVQRPPASLPRAILRYPEEEQS